MNKQGKTAIIIVIAVAILTACYFLFFKKNEPKKKTDNKSEDNKDGNNKDGNNKTADNKNNEPENKGSKTDGVILPNDPTAPTLPVSEEYKNTSFGWVARPQAIKVYNALYQPKNYLFGKDGGTDEQALYAVFEEAQNEADIKTLENEFRFVLMDEQSEHKSLGEFLRSDGELQNINAILQRKGIKYQLK